MNVAIIIAGGVGSRMNMDIPKQFIHIYDKPVIIYTLEGFQRHPEIDAIEVVCLAGWEDTLRDYARQYGITKLKWITTGGATGQESIRNGVYNLEGELKGDDIAIVHDGIRPMVSNEIISDNIAVCRAHGNAITVLPSADALCRSSDGESSSILDNPTINAWIAADGSVFQRFWNSFCVMPETLANSLRSLFPVSTATCILIIAFEKAVPPACASRPTEDRAVAKPRICGSVRPT